MQVILTVAEGPHQGREFAFEAHDTFIVGRAKCAHFRLPEKDKFFSRVHFMVEVNPPHCRLMDLGSRNGTVVNGKTVVAADLKDGDLIRGGKTVIRVAIHDQPPSVATPAQPCENLSDLSTIEPRLALRLPSTVSFRPSDSPPKSDSRSDLADAAAKTPASCVVCGCAVAAEMSSATGLARGIPARESPICAACQEKIRGQPQPIAGYQIVKELGRGGMGVVYLALRAKDCESVAIKTILPAVATTRRDVEKFLREASILGELDHPNIVTFREIGEAGDLLYFVMEFVRGRDAAHLLRELGGPMPIQRAVRLVGQLLQALDYAHAKGFVHRDIKPSNLLVASNPSPAASGRDGATELAKLADFGLARTFQASRISGLTMTGFGGTIQFMAPEQLTNYRGATPAVDIYAAGATLYTLLTGRFVYDFPEQPQRRIAMLLQEDPVPIKSRRPDIPQDLAAAVHRSLARDPAQRFSDSRSLRRALAQFE